METSVVVEKIRGRGRWPSDRPGLRVCPVCGRKTGEKGGGKCWRCRCKRPVEEYKRKYWRCFCPTCGRKMINSVKPLCEYCRRYFMAQLVELSMRKREALKEEHFRMQRLQGGKE